MSRHVTYIAAVTALIVSSVTAVVAGAPERLGVVLLPVEQTCVAEGSRLCDRDLATALLAELTRTVEFALVALADIETAVDDQLVDDALFELAVTGDLDQTLRTLEACETEAGRRRLLGRTAHQRGVSYSIEVALKTCGRSLRVSYRIIDVESNRVVRAKSFADVLRDRGGVTRETAKRIMRSLWQAKHCDGRAAQS